MCELLSSISNVSYTMKMFKGKRKMVEGDRVVDKGEDSSYVNYALSVTRALWENAAVLDKERCYQRVIGDLEKFSRYNCEHHVMYTDVEYMTFLHKKVYELPVLMQNKEIKKIRKLEHCLDLVDSMTEC